MTDNTRIVPGTRVAATGAPATRGDLVAQVALELESMVSNSAIGVAVWKAHDDDPDRMLRNIVAFVERLTTITGPLLMRISDHDAAEAEIDAFADSIPSHL